jgi:SRSO17 transposase
MVRSVIPDYGCLWWNELIDPTGRYRELKGAMGLDHFEGRSFGGWHHHATLVTVARGFLTLERLRRPKPAASA